MLNQEKLKSGISWLKVSSAHHNTPRVSVVIPTYNHARFLGDALNSVLTQTYANVEIIVIDDGSTDNTREVMAAYENCVCYIRQENQGLSAARNAGLRVCTGEFIALLDADDVLEPEYLSRMTEVLIKNSQVDGIYCGYRFMDEDNNLLFQVENRLVDSKQLYGALLGGNFFVPESTIVRRSCYDSAGFFDETLTACEDWDMWLRFSKHFKIIGIPEVLVRYRIVKGSMSSDPERMLDNRLIVLEKHLGPIESGRVQSVELAYRSYAQAYIRACIEYLQKGDPQAAYDRLYTAAGLYPWLLTEPTIFYELVCNDQARGYRGDVTKLNIERNGMTVLQMLDRLFTDSHRSSDLVKLNRTVFATAHATLSMLHYNAGETWQARRYAYKAVITDASIGFKPKMGLSLIRSALGPTTVRWLKHAWIKLQILQAGSTYTFHPTIGP